MALANKLHKYAAMFAVPISHYGRLVPISKPHSPRRIFEERKKKKQLKTLCGVGSLIAFRRNVIT